MLEDYHHGSYESPTSFVAKLYEMVSQEPDDIICFVPDGSAFEIRNPKKLERDILATYFRHKKFQSLVRQLNFYNFKKDRGVWIYRHQMFHRDQPKLLSKLKRKTNSIAFPKKSSKVSSKKVVSSDETEQISPSTTPLASTDYECSYEMNENAIEESENTFPLNGENDCYSVNSEKCKTPNYYHPSDKCHKNTSNIFCSQFDKENDTKYTKYQSIKFTTKKEQTSSTNKSSGFNRSKDQHGDYLEAPLNKIKMNNVSTMSERVAAATILTLNPAKLQTGLEILVEQSMYDLNTKQKENQRFKATQKINNRKKNSFNEDFRNNQYDQNTTNAKNFILDRFNEQQFDMRNTISPTQNKRKSFFETYKRSSLVEMNELSNDTSSNEFDNSKYSPSKLSSCIFSKSLFQECSEVMNCKENEKCASTPTKDTVECNAINNSSKSKLNILLNVLKQFNKNARDCPNSVYMYRNLLIHNPEMNIDFLSYCSALNPNKSSQVSSSFGLFCLFLTFKIEEALIEECSETLLQSPFAHTDDSSMSSFNSNSFVIGEKGANKPPQNLGSYLRCWIDHLRSLL